MTDAALSTPVTLNRADGSSLTFKRCSPADRIAYRRVFRLYRKHWLAESLRVLGIAGDAAVAHLNRLDAAPLKESHLVNLLNEPEGQHEAILLSLRADKPDATIDDVYALNLNDDESLTVAAGVMNVPLVPVKGGADPLPESPPPRGGGTGTGSPTPTPSGTSAESPTPSGSPSTCSTPASATPAESAA
jgi:hypothetical protein